MEAVSNTIFQINDPAVKSTYAEKDNYKVKIHEGPDTQEDLCVIYFSSNDLYYPNTSKAFEASILTKDKYEWQRNFLKIAHKHIFIRDIQKQWYIEGINKTYDTPEKLLELLQALTKGFRIYTIGSSAGGFAAMLYGSLLKAERVYAFNAQLNLNIILKGSKESTDPLLFKHKDTIRSKYFLISNFCNPTTDYFYFQSSKSAMDNEQFEAFDKKGAVTKIPFKTSNHGFPFLRHNLGYVLQLNKKELIALANRHYHPFLFSVSIDGWLKSIKIVAIAVFNRFKKKLIEKKAAF